MKKEGLNIHIHLTNRWLYTIIAIGILAAISVGVYAYGTSNPSAFGHSIGEIATCAANQILKMNSAGTSWECGSDDVGSISTNPLYVEGAITAPEGTLRDDGGGWLRTYGQTGWYSQTYGGGWYMTDTSWIRAYNSKSVYTPGQVRGDAGLCIGTDCRTSWPATGITTETDPTVQSWAKTNNPYLNGGTIMTLNTSRLRISNSILYSIGVPAGYTTIDTCTTLCNNNRPIGVGSTANMCLYAWTYTSPNWAFSTCAATGSARRNCLCLAMYDY